MKNQLQFGIAGERPTAQGSDQRSDALAWFLTEVRADDVDTYIEIIREAQALGVEREHATGETCVVQIFPDKILLLNALPPYKRPHVMPIEGEYTPEEFVEALEAWKADVLAVMAQQRTDSDTG